MSNEKMNNEMNVNAESRKENTMSIEARIMEAIKEQGGKDVVVTYREVTKNNGQVRKAYTVQECGSTLAPTIYIDQFDDIVGDEEKNDRIVEYVVNAFRTECQRGIEIDISEFMSREYVLNNVIPVLVNVERNLDFLTEAVHRVYTDDLAIIYKIPLVLGENGEGTITILNKHMNIIGINSENELYEHAVENVQGTGIIDGMADMMAMLGHDEVSEASAPMQIITNTKMTYGANVILDNEIIKRLIELKNDESISNVYAIPSSIHEFIIVAKTIDDDSLVEYISNLIKVINRTELEQEDILSDNLFEFDGKMLHKVEI